MKNQFYSGKNILLTGATGDLGDILARKLGESEARLVVTSRSEKKLRQLADPLPNVEKLVTLKADLSKPGQAALLAERALKQVGHVDILINNAGLGYFALMEEADEQKIRYLFEVNTFSPIALINALVPHMVERGSGRIVNIVSINGKPKPDNNQAIFTQHILK